ncbi:MAG: hypothetical protein KDD40_10745 [Bdellovibrionales bacterium]|nr:hypothetical protein [Bdellovibrionales bacterium]
MQKYFGPRLKLGFKLLLSLVIFALVMRVAFAFYFFPPNRNDFTLTEWLKAFYLGSKFDLRVSLVFALPFFLLSPFSIFNPVAKPHAIKAWHYFYTFLFFLLLEVYSVDFGYYDYLKDRLNASFLQFFANFWISAEMVWQTYPIIPAVIISLIFIYILHYLIGKLVFRLPTNLIDERTKKQKYTFGILTTLLILFGLYGKLSYYPLRWSEVFFFFF